MKYEIDIFHYFNIYKKHWKRMTFLIAAVTCITAVVEFVKPKIYRSTLIALSSAQATQAGNIGQVLGLPSRSSDDVIFSILRSRRMIDDINLHFKLKERPRFWWKIDTYIVTGGFAVEVTGSDPELTRDIADFAADNVDTINEKIDFSPERGLVKVLDKALEGTPIRRNISKKVIASGLFVFLAYALFIFFKEYFSNLKKLRK